MAQVDKATIQCDGSMDSYFRSGFKCAVLLLFQIYKMELFLKIYAMLRRIMIHIESNL